MKAAKEKAPAANGRATAMIRKTSNTRANQLQGLSDRSLKVALHTLTDDQRAVTLKVIVLKQQPARTRTVIARVQRLADQKEVAQ